MIEEIFIPQMGEGLQEVVILKFYKKPGDVVKRDETIYSMETDKAVLEVESPHDGVLREWLAEEGSVLPIGSPIARIEVTSSVPTHSNAPSVYAEQERKTLPTSPATVIPPRTRAYCKENGISEEEMLLIPTPTGKLLPEHVDAYLQTKKASTSVLPISATMSAPSSEEYVDRPLTTHQRTFIHRLKRSQQIVVPANAKRPINWGKIRAYVETLRDQEGLLQPSAFQTFAFCVAQAIKQHPRFRSALIGETTMREYPHVNLGIAVALAEGDLVTAVIPHADKLEFHAFIQAAQKHIQQARQGQDQATETTQFLLTYLGPYEIMDAIPVLVAPAVGVLFVGSPYQQEGKLLANLSLTFDHRLVQGMDAALFLQTIAQNVETVEEIVR